MSHRIPCAPLSRQYHRGKATSLTAAEATVDRYYNLTGLLLLLPMSLLRWTESQYLQTHTLSSRTISFIGVANDYGLEGREVRFRFPVAARIFCSPSRPDRLWDPPNFLSNAYRGLFPRGYNSGGVKLTTHLQLVPR
jgi:hypothetical protein